MSIELPPRVAFGWEPALRKHPLALEGVLQKLAAGLALWAEPCVLRRVASVTVRCRWAGMSPPRTTPPHRGARPPPGAATLGAQCGLLLLLVALELLLVLPGASACDMTLMALITWCALGRCAGVRDQHARASCLRSGSGHAPRTHAACDVM